MKKLLFTCSLLFTLTLLGQSYPIGHTTIMFEDPERGNRQIETEIYYPATAACDDTPGAAGEFPVIVFGHGFVMAWSAYANLWEEFVPRGYIMAFPRTEDGLVGTNHQEFGWDLQFLVTAMQQKGNDPTSVLHNLVASETALMGHSMGGGAAFLAADSLVSNGNINLKTLVGLAPAESTSNGVSSIASATQITLPLLILSGEQDGVTPPVDHHIPMYNNLASDCKTIIHVIGGAHCYFANSNFQCDFGVSTSSTGISISRQAQHQVTFDFVNLWLDYTLKADCNDFTTFNDSLAISPRINFDQVCNGPLTFESS
jgi:predicted dienelactone hydrolase